jgi:hypothetical protein
MFTYIAEGFVAISVIGSMSLLAGLLRAAKAASQVSEHEQDSLAHPAGNDEQRSTGQQQRNRLNKLLVAF